MNVLRKFRLPTLALFFVGAMLLNVVSDWFNTPRTGVPFSTPSGLVVAADAENSRNPENVSMTHPKEQTPEMWTMTRVLFKGETLQLHFTVPHAPYLGLVDPKGAFFYLVYPMETAVGELMPLVESKRFVTLQSLYINTASLRADPYLYDVFTNQPVFTQSGSFTFILGENLHVDDPDLLSSVVVRYIHMQRPLVERPDPELH